jgi:hypothetical protein
MKLPWDPRLRELVALAVLGAFGCGLALSQGDLLFVAIFVAACAVNYRGDTTFTVRNDRRAEAGRSKKAAPVMRLLAMWLKRATGLSVTGA